MSWNPALEPRSRDMGTADSIETLIIPRARDLGGFSVRRALPAPQRQMVGPFIFFDQMGPVEFLTAGGIDVRPHPHIGLATVTYLHAGAFRHRDSTGADQTILPGDVNWMIAGSGVTHSERTGAERTGAERTGAERTGAATQTAPHSLSGIQTWVALPEAHEDDAASFEHRGAAELPLIEGEGKSVRLILGTAYGARAPVSTFSEMVYADAILDAGARLPMPGEHEDRGLYVVDGSVEVAGDRIDAGRMVVFRPGDAITLTAGEAGARLMILGGETLPGPRFIWWNFVASSRERIEAAKDAWRAADFSTGRFRLPPGDDAEFIPLP